MTVAADFADWLKSPTLYASAAGAPGWGDIARQTTVQSCLALAADAATEAARQVAFLGPARVIEQLSVPGHRCAELIGRAVTLTADAPGYRTGATVFVISAQESEAESRTLLKVIRRL